MKKDKNKAPTKYYLWLCAAIIYALYRTSRATGNIVFLYLTIIPGLLVLVICFDMFHQYN